MRINLAHFWVRATDGSRIECAVFDADARDTSREGRSRFLNALTMDARGAGLRIDQSALAFVEHGELTYFGNPNLTKYLATNGLPDWTNTLDI